MNKFYVWISETGQSLAIKHHADMLKDIFFVKIPENGQRLGSEYHFKMSDDPFF